MIRTAFRKSAMPGAAIAAGLVCDGGEFCQFIIVGRGVGAGLVDRIGDHGDGIRGGGKLAGFRSGRNGGGFLGWLFLWRFGTELGDALAVGAFIGGGGAGAPVVVGDAFVPFGAGFGSG